MSLLSHYIKLFSKLNRATVSGDKAPHKPILLLSIIQLIDNRTVTENKIFITSDLVATFKDLWRLLVKNPMFTDNFSLPFFHLRSEGFWLLHTFSGKELILSSSHSIRSFAQLKETIAFASFDASLFSLLLDTQDRAVLKQTLLQVYFPATDVSSLHSPPILFNTIKNQILKEDANVYRKEIEEADEEEIFIRSGVFKKVIPAIYDNTCCITKMKVISTYNIQMIDACHIKPFSVSHDDTITNGVSLCPNMHRAFDRGLLSLDDNYRVMVSDSFKETDNVYSLKQYAGMQIHLPNEIHYLPHQENLAWHREHIFK